MESEIVVKVLVRRGTFYLRYVSPETGKNVEKSSKATKRSDAIMDAGKWQAELREGRYAKQSKMSWETFREFYRQNALPSLTSHRSVECYESTLNVFERACNPKRIADVTTSKILAFVKHLREQGRAEATVARHLRHLKATVRWAHRHDLLAVLPRITIPKRIKGSKIMRGRPLCKEEFERMLEAVPLVVESVAATSWDFFLKGLWESGLRLAEALSLRWDESLENAMVVDFSDEMPMLRIPGDAQKSREDQLWPITPSFAALLESVPESQRRGRVFKLISPSGRPMTVSEAEVSRIITRMGKKAGIVVDERMKTKLDENGKPQHIAVRKYASAHDFRRSFGKRWASKLMPQELQALMRHASITTTMSYYVGSMAKEAAKKLWAAESDAVR